MAYSTVPMAGSQYYGLPAYCGVQACMDPRACKLKVQGQGIIMVQPDTANVVLGVVTENKQLELAQKENALKINAILNALKGMGIKSEDIQTANYSIDPQYDFVEGKQVFRGYRVLHSLRIIVRDVGSVGKVVDTAVENGANQVDSIRFSVSNPSRYYQRAMEAAIDDAVAKARTVGRKLNIVVSAVPAQIVEESVQEKPPVTPFLLQAAEAATQIQTGQIEVIARIEAVFTYMPGSGQEVGGLSM